ncbi:MAG: phenylalanine--tRNA ligase subunit alpha [Candidatus Coatesbacteria bacterium]|nr:phenylalanine--tRNA ligase subunit alpha [Candidatus Coatesbacteria bacterium]
MIDNIGKISEEARESFASVGSSDKLEELRIKYLGKRGIMATLLKEIGALDNEHRPAAGKAINDARRAISSYFDEAKARLDTVISGKSRVFDYTLPAYPFPKGFLHPCTQVMDEIVDIFVEMGFRVELGPEVELDYYNFEALNTPRDHPARDLHDTFYISEDVLLRTHTSPVQVRVMEKVDPPVQMISPGVAYRRDADVTHLPMFSQVEGLLVDRGVTFGHLKGVLMEFARQMFGENRKTRFRPHYFPFTEPSAEMDISCGVCSGKGCRACKGTGWLEILGCGMVHPHVLEMVHYDTEAFTGFAFGMGIERITMLKYDIADIRLLLENDLRFLKQF